MLLHAQDKGVHFEQGLTWDQVKAKAKAEKKDIFMDCYATWCGPCKIMDATVYPKDSVGIYLNKKFISVKVQMDTSKNDNGETKSWYADAKEIREEYAITAMPSFLFFNSAGKPMDKEVGAKDEKKFIAMVKDVFTPSNQYYTLFTSYQNSSLDYNMMPKLAKMADKIGEKDKSLQIAKDYMHQVLDKLPDSQFRKKENLGFISSFDKMVTTKDRIFELYYHHMAEMDSIMSDGYSKTFVNQIISNEEIVPAIEAAKNTKSEPNWKNMERTIKNKYGSSYADQNILTYKVFWYKFNKEWGNYTKYLSLSMNNNLNMYKEIGGLGALMGLNNNAFEVFKYSNNKKELSSALVWIELAIPMVEGYLKAGVLDTKANILYKLGRKEEAFATEQEAQALDPKSNKYKEVNEKMRLNLPTWSQN